MHTFFKFAKNKNMKTSTKIFIGLFLITLIPALIMGGEIFKGIVFNDGKISVNLSVQGIIALVLLILAMILGLILYIKFILSLSFEKVIFFSSLPLIVIYGIMMFLLADLASLDTEFANTIKNLLNISVTNEYNTILWAILITLVFILLLYINYLIICKPMRKMEKIILRLGDGVTGKSNFTIGGSKQFKNIEHGLNKINNSYKKEGFVVQNCNKNKNISKQLLKFLGKDGLESLERENKFDKFASIVFFKLEQGANFDDSSLQDKFQIFNSYKNKMYPLIKKYNGFIDRLIDDGVIAVFPRSNFAIECAHSIFHLFKERERSGILKLKVIIHSANIELGFSGDDKNIKIISNIYKNFETLSKILNFMNIKFLITKDALDDLPIDFKLDYRLIGHINLNEKNIDLFDDLSVYSRDKSIKLYKDKRLFEKAVLLYDENEFQKAIYYFEQLVKNCPDDYPAYIYFNKTKEKLAI